MPDTIKDGKGRGYLASVDPKNRLWTIGVGVSEEHLSSAQDQGSYFPTIADQDQTLTLSAGMTGPVFYLKNLSDSQRLVIYKILFGSNTAGVIVKMVKNMAVATITNYKTHAPCNQNFSSTNTADVLCYTWDEVSNGMTTFTGGTTIMTYILGIGTVVFPIDSGFMLNQNDSLTFYAKTAAEFTCGVRFYFHYEEA